MAGNNKMPAYLREHLTHTESVVGSGNGNRPGTEKEEDSCPAFGFLRGLDVRALMVEFRLASGNSEWFAYSCLVSCRHNPSVGLLLKFSSGDVTSLVLIHGSNLEAPVGQGEVNLTDRGLQRHRIVYVREMNQEELQKKQQDAPTIDSIDIAEFETAEEQREWLKERAPVFLRK
ncbi:MAG TPA: hypothetical protein VH592_23735 [Gemmataceae bacterium]|jgi:hypothetical protein